MSGLILLQQPFVFSGLRNSIHLASARSLESEDNQLLKLPLRSPGVPLAMNLHLSPYGSLPNSLRLVYDTTRKMLLS